MLLFLANYESQAWHCTPHPSNKQENKITFKPLTTSTSHKLRVLPDFASVPKNIFKLGLLLHPLFCKQPSQLSSIWQPSLGASKYIDSMLFTCCIGVHCRAGAWFRSGLHSDGFRWFLFSPFLLSPFPLPVPLIFLFLSKPPLASPFFSSPLSSPSPLLPSTPVSNLLFFLSCTTHSLYALRPVEGGGCRCLTHIPPWQTCAISLLRLSPQVRQAGATVAARGLIECN